MTVSSAEKSALAHDGGRNCSIDIFRAVCAILVVAIHADPVGGMNLPILRSVLNSVEFIAVPFFFMTAGYFFSNGFTKKREILLPYLKRLLIPYAAWSSIYMLAEFFRAGKYNIRVFFANCFFRFFISGSEYHLWYFPAVITAVIIVALFFVLRLEKLIFPVSFLLYAYFIAGKCYLRLFENSPALTAFFSIFQNYSLQRLFLYGVPCFCAGYPIKLLHDRNGFVCRNSKAITAFFAVMFVCEYILITSFGVSSPSAMFSHYFLAASILITLLEYPMPKKQKSGKICRIFASFTYYSHPIFLMLLDSLAVGQISTLLRYILAVALCALFSWGIYKADNKYLNTVCC